MYRRTALPLTVALALGICEPLSGILESSTSGSDGLSIDDVVASSRHGIGRSVEMRRWIGARAQRIGRHGLLLGQC